MDLIEAGFELLASFVWWRLAVCLLIGGLLILGFETLVHSPTLSHILSALVGVASLVVAIKWERKKK